MNPFLAHLNQLLASIVPTFGVFGAGWLCRRIGIWDRSAVRVLNSYAYYIALPALIFQSILSSGIGSSFNRDDAKLLAGALAAHLIIALTAGAALLARRVSNDIRAVAPMLLVFGSTAYLGIPYATNTFGKQGTTYASLLSVALVVTLLFVSVIFLQRYGRSPDHMGAVKRFLELPFLWAVVLGLGWSLGGVPRPPEFVSRTVDVLAGSAGPTALLALGAFQYGFSMRRVPLIPAALLGLGKVVLPSGLTFLILRFLGLSGLRLAVGTAMGAVSVAVTAFLLADRYRVRREIVVGAMTFSSLFGFLALSLISWLWISTPVFGG